MQRLLLLLLLGLSQLVLRAQNTIVQQGFEGTGGCPDWTYSGGTVNTQTAHTGTHSVRVGRSGENSTVTFSPVTTTGYSNMQLSIYHSVIYTGCSGCGEGIDTEEGATMQVRLNGGAWTTVGAVGGFSNCAWDWTASSGGCGGMCGTTCPNPMVYNVPNGTSTVEVRFYSNNCPSGVASLYDRTDEGFYVDDVKLTTTSPVVTPGSGTLTWAGGFSSDWFDCRNWNPTYLPGPGWDVIVNQTGANPCVVGNSISTPTNAYCASLTVSSTGVSRKLMIDNGRSLEVGGATLVQRAGVGIDTVVVLVNNGIFKTNDLIVSGLGAVFRNNVAANTAQVKGNLTLSSSGKVNLNNGVLHVAGNIANNVGTSAFMRTNSTVILDGTTAQTISATVTPDTYASLSIAKETAQDVTLAAGITVTGTLDLTLGRLFTSAGSLLTMKAGSTAINASNGSFVCGPVRKEGNSAFTFPTGKDHVYRPISIAGTILGTGTFGTNLPTNNFQAEYFNASPGVAVGTAHDVTLDHISDCEYWMLDRTGAVASTPFVRLSWDTPASCGVTAPSELRVAHWTGANWSDRGNGGTTGSTTTGTVTTLTAQSSFSPWTLASITVNNPLPIQLLSFTAEPEGDEVRLRWTTLTEEDNDHFTVERSGPDLDFEAIGQLPGAGNSSSELHYTLPDEKPLAGLSYYRLRQTDTDGASTLSAIVPVQRNGRFGHDLDLFLSDEQLLVRHALPAGTYFLFDANGRLVQEGAALPDLFTIPVGNLPRGLYLLRVTAGGNAASARFMH